MTDLITFLIGASGFAIVAAIAYRAGVRRQKIETRAWARDCLQAENVSEILYQALQLANNPDSVVLTSEERATWASLTGEAGA